jgi:hypothetical protein
MKKTEGPVKAIVFLGLKINSELQNVTILEKNKNNNCFSKAKCIIETIAIPDRFIEFYM